MIVPTRVAALTVMTTGLLLVAVLRRPWRSVFGAERAYALWLAVPLALVVAWIPHTATSPVYASVVTLLETWPTTGTAVEHPALPTLYTLTNVLSVLWIAGSVLWLAVIALAQWRYTRRLRGMRLAAMPGTRIRIAIAHADNVGPALVGAWRPRIVLPADFDTRFEPDEQTLIVRHEAIHARRRDGIWILLAHAVASAFWFHPLIWWALRAFRQDQELACDAAVIRERPESRRTYASAMLKTHDATLLPIGCTWKSHHPLTERIAMLKAITPSYRRRNAALVALPLAMLAIAGAGYAASPATGAAPPSASIYQLATRFESNGTLLAAATICVAEGTPGTIRDVTRTGKDAWELVFSVKPVDAGLLQVDVDTSLDEGKERKTSHQSIRGKAGETLSVRYGDGADAGSRILQVTPVNGCPAATGKNVVQVTEKMLRGTARATAMALADRGGITLVNPEVLDESPVALNFEHLDVRDALRHVAEIDGRTARFEGASVSFAKK